MIGEHRKLKISRKKRLRFAAILLGGALGGVLLATAAGVEPPAKEANDENSKLETSTGRKAFLVGADDYANVDSLDCVKNDVEALEKRLEEIGFEPRNITTLKTGGNFGDYPTKANIEERFAAFVDNLQPGDFVVVFLSGHGLQPNDSTEKFFAPIDLKIEKPFETAVSIDKMLAQLEKSRATFRWMIVDACRNDPRRSEAPTKALGVRGLGDFSNAPRSISLLLSCQPGAVSYEGGFGKAKDVDNGFLTLGLLEALDANDSKADANNDGVLSFWETLKYVSDRTNELAYYYYGKTQKPNLTGDVTDFALIDDLRVDGISRADWKRANSFWEEAQAARREQRYAAAEEKIDAALQIAPNNEKFLTAKTEIEQLCRSVEADEEESSMMEIFTMFALTIAGVVLPILGALPIVLPLLLLERIRSRRKRRLYEACLRATGMSEELVKSVAVSPYFNPTLELKPEKWRERAAELRNETMRAMAEKKALGRKQVEAEAAKKSSEKSEARSGGSEETR
ncbi:MAG: caspase family protein [Thermoguttaceae bacterium]|nr:caspase family protein [Thermoguttaceae bacterium]